MLIFSRADIISFASMEFKLIGLLKSKKKRKNLVNFAIMPSKYTDEIENSSYTWRVFLCLENQNIV